MYGRGYWRCSYSGGEKTKAKLVKEIRIYKEDVEVNRKIEHMERG